MKKFLISLLFLMSFPLPLLAGGAFSTTPDGIPVLWDTTITWRAEEGPLKIDQGGGDGGGDSGGCQLTKAISINNAQAVQMVDNAFRVWQAVPNSNIQVQQGPSLGVEVDFFNLEDFFVGSFFGGSIPSNATSEGCYGLSNAECNNGVFFDSSVDPQLSEVDAVLGECMRFNVLAFASILPLVANDSPQFTIQEPGLRSAQMMISGTCVDPVNPPDANCPSACPQGGVTLEQLQGTITHEVGHFIGLDHTLVNPDLFEKCLDGSINAAEAEQIPTMIGLFCPAANLNTPARDDQAAAGTFYPAANFANLTCSISGITTLANGTPQRCLEVVARELGNDKGNAVATISGAFAERFTQGVNGLSGTSGKNIVNCTESAAQCAAYEIHGLTPGTYKMTVHDFSLTNGTGDFDFILEPCTPDFASDSVGAAGIDDPDNPTIVCTPGGNNQNVTVRAN